MLRGVKKGGTSIAVRKEEDFKKKEPDDIIGKFVRNIDII